jgi:hypothetical protein
MANARIIARKLAGLCISCGKPSRATKSKCIVCKDADTARRRKSHDDKKMRGECMSCTSPVDGNTIYCKQHRQRCNDNSISYWRNFRRLVYDHYGHKCNCCGETEEMFLTVDHINNTGADHRRAIGKGNQIHKYIVEHDYPNDFQILCMNCNLGKSRNGGRCPHSNPVKLTLVS